MQTLRGPGRPRELTAKKKVLVTLEQHLLDFLERYRVTKGLQSRSAALRRILTNLSIGQWS